MDHENLSHIRELLAELKVKSVEPPIWDIRPRPYFDEHLGIETVIEQHLKHQLPYATFRTIGQLTADVIAVPQQTEDFTASQYARQRFEIELQGVLLNADATRGPDISLSSGALFEAYSAAIHQCASASGIDEVWQLLQPSDGDVAFVSREQYVDAAASLGLTRNELLDLRSVCSQYAASYPTLDADERDALLRELENHYVRAVRDWLQETDLDDDLARLDDDFVQ